MTQVKVFLTYNGHIMDGATITKKKIEEGINEWIKEEKPKIKWRPHQTNAGGQHVLITIYYEKE